MVAIAIGAAVVGSVGSAVVSTSASNKAAKTAKDNAAANNALQSSIYDQNKAALSPYVGAGVPATSSIQALLGLSGDPAQATAALKTYYDSTAYTSRLKQGQDGVTAALGSRGMLESGAADKALTKYGQDYASGEFDKYMSYLAGQQGVGLTAASAQAGVGQNYANAVSANNNNAANTVSNAALSNAGTISGALGGLTSAIGLGLGSSYGKSAGGSGWGGINYGILND
jgi:hypothetical protein